MVKSVDCFRDVWASYKDEFQATIEKVGNGLEKHLNTPIEFLSGGQRQALSLLMATLKRPELLLLDEHTAALDPKDKCRTHGVDR